MTEKVKIKHAQQNDFPLGNPKREGEEEEMSGGKQAKDKVCFEKQTFSAATCKLE